MPIDFPATGAPNDKPSVSCAWPFETDDCASSGGVELEVEFDGLVDGLPCRFRAEASAYLASAVGWDEDPFDAAERQDLEESERSDSPRTYDIQMVVIASAAGVEEEWRSSRSCRVRELEGPGGEAESREAFVEALRGAAGAIAATSAWKAMARASSESRQRAEAARKPGEPSAPVGGPSRPRL